MCPILNQLHIYPSLCVMSEGSSDLVFMGGHAEKPPKRATGVEVSEREETGMELAAQAYPGTTRLLLARHRAMGGEGGRPACGLTSWRADGRLGAGWSVTSAPALPTGPVSLAPSGSLTGGLSNSSSGLGRCDRERIWWPWAETASSLAFLSVSFCSGLCSNRINKHNPRSPNWPFLEVPTCFGRWVQRLAWEWGETEARVLDGGVLLRFLVEQLTQKGFGMW